MNKEWAEQSLIGEDEQIFFVGNYQNRINSPIITTGNELVREQIVEFSEQLNIKELYSYIFEVEEFRRFFHVWKKRAAVYGNLRIIEV